MGDNVKKKKNESKLKKIIKNKYTYLAVFLVLITFSYLTLTNSVNIEKYLRDVIFYPFKNINSQPFIEEVEKELRDENNELKKLVDIGDSLSSYDVIYATVIERNNSYWNNSLTINKGSDDGVEEGLAVVDGNGVVGRIDRVNNNNSTIKLITSYDKYNTLSIKIKSETEINKILKASNNKLIIEGINKNSNVKVGDMIITNGLSNKFPSGLVIGKISSIDSDYYNVSNTATVSLLANIENLRFVAILKRKI